MTGLDQVDGAHPIRRFALGSTNQGKERVAMDVTMQEQKEGPVARAIERQTSRIPSDFFLWTGLAAIGTSLTLSLFGKQKVANFVGQWVPTVLLLGVYNKIVKVAGHDRQEPDLH
jgi:hypothetical protein